MTFVVDPYIRVYHDEGAPEIGTGTAKQERFFRKHPGITDPYFSRWFDQTRATYEMDLGRNWPWATTASSA